MACEQNCDDGKFLLWESMYISREFPVCVMFEMFLIKNTVEMRFKNTNTLKLKNLFKIEF
jgi:hypothetical protein